MTTQIQIGGQVFEASALNLPASRENRDAWAIDPNDPTTVIEDPALIEANAQARATALLAEVTQDSATLKALGNLIAEVAFRSATSDFPANLTRTQARTFVRDTLEEAINTDLGISQN